MKILLCSMPDTVPQFSAKTWRAPNLAISSIAGNIQLHHEVILADLVLKRKNLLSSIKKAIDYLHNNNILIVGGMIIGHSEDKEEDIAQNFEFFDKANIDFYGEQIITPYPKTGMRDILIKEGLVTNTSDYSKYNGFWANVRAKHLSSEDLQFLRWKYKRKYSTFFKTTPVFKANFPKIDLLRIFILRPYYRIRNFITSMGKSERDIFERDRKRFAEMNNFFNKFK